MFKPIRQEGSSPDVGAINNHGKVNAAAIAKVSMIEILLRYLSRFMILHYVFLRVFSEVNTKLKYPNASNQEKKLIAKAIKNCFG